MPVNLHHERLIQANEAIERILSSRTCSRKFLFIPNINHCPTSRNRKNPEPPPTALAHALNSTRLLTLPQLQPSKNI